MMIKDNWVWLIYNMDSRTVLEKENIYLITQKKLVNNWNHTSNKKMGERTQ